MSSYNASIGFSKFEKCPRDPTAQGLAILSQGSCSLSQVQGSRPVKARLNSLYYDDCKLGEEDERVLQDSAISHRLRRASESLVNQWSLDL